MNGKVGNRIAIDIAHDHNTICHPIVLELSGVMGKWRSSNEGKSLIAARSRIGVDFVEIDLVQFGFIDVLYVITAYRRNCTVRQRPIDKRVSAFADTATSDVLRLKVTFLGYLVTSLQDGGSVRAKNLLEPCPGVRR